MTVTTKLRRYLVRRVKGSVWTFKLGHYREFWRSPLIGSSTPRVMRRRMNAIVLKGLEVFEVFEMAYMAGRHELGEKG